MKKSESTENGPAISVRNLSKAYRIWEKPSARLTVPLWVAAARLFPAQSRFSRWVKGKASACYHDYFALNDVSFEIEKGESVGIIGRNGSGKSTLLKILSGILEPVAGEGAVRGNCAALLELGSGFNPEFTGRENVYMNAALWGLSDAEIDARFGKIAEFADIGEFIEQPVKTYSSGMFVRLAFAVAIHVEPEIFLVDEVLAVGDVFFRQKCLWYMREKMARATRLFVSHDMHTIISLCSRVLVMEGGCLVFDGSSRDAVEFYTKSAHNEQVYTSELGEVVYDQRGQAQPLDDIDWSDVEPASCSGAGEVMIEKIAVTNGESSAAAVVRPGDRIAINMLVHAKQAKENLMFGYLVRDRVGLDIFGENSVRTEGLLSIDAGYSSVYFEFIWPDIRPAEYTLTLGVGEGTNPLEHIIQCWTHNVKAFEMISSAAPVHCLFNNKIEAFRLDENR